MALGRPVVAFGEDWWRAARALYAAGVRKGDIVHNTFAYHLTPADYRKRCSNLPD